jgi:predicted membrane protein
MQKRYWLRGGVISFFIAFLHQLYGVVYFVGSEHINYKTLVWASIFLILATLAGATIGFIYGKIKNRKKVI